MGSKSYLFYRAPVVIVAIVSFLCSQSFGPLALALPAGEQVVGGSASFDRSTNSLDITTSDKAIINYDGFSIAGGEAVRFLQPGASSVVLNRVTGGSISEILGSLSANGNIFLINPAGVVFGAGSVVNVAGLLASTLDISNEDFMEGRYNFEQVGANPGSVVNNGSIAAGSVGLIGGAVANNGRIEAQMGRVTLAAGSAATVSFDGDGLISVAVSDAVTKAAKYADGSSAADAVVNAGTIEANGGSVILTARTAADIFTNAVNNTGILRAAAVQSRGGLVRLAAEGPRTIAANTGIIDVSGMGEAEYGGRVEILGDRVGLFGGVVDASGDAGGGSVIIGGTDTTATYVGPDAVIKADAIRSGDGGNVVVWSNNVTRYYGTITAGGGVVGGNGGQAEVSSKDSLIYRGHVRLPASYGHVGTLLVDPKNITIAAGNDTIATNNEFAENNNGSVTFRIDGGGGDDIVAALNGANVTLQANNDITITSAIDASGNAGIGSLTLQAGRSIVISNNVTLRGSFSATANIGTAQAGSRDGGNAQITMGAFTINTSNQNGTITLQYGNGPNGNDATGLMTVGSLNSGSGAITLNTTANDGGGASREQITFNGTINGGATAATAAVIFFGGVVGGTTPPASLTLNSTDAVTFSANATVAGAVAITAVNVNFNNPFTTTTGGTMTVTNSGTLFTGAAANMILDGAFSQDGIGPNNIAGNITTSNDNVAFLRAVSLGGAVAIDTGPGIGDITFLFTLNGAQTLTLTAGTGNIAFADVTGGVTPLTGLTVNSAAATTFNAAATYAGAVAITAVNVNFNFAFSTNVAAGTVTVVNSGTLSTVAAGDLSLEGAFFQNGAGVNSIAGDITTTNDAITFTTAVTLTGNVLLNTGAGAGTVTFSGTLNGAQNLGITAGTGNVVFTGAVGSGTRLGALTISSAADVMVTSTMKATTITQTAGTGVTRFNDVVDTTLAGGISLTSTNFMIADIRAAAGGVSITAGDGSITEIGSDSAADITAAADSSLTARGANGFIGTDSNALEVQIAGTLTVIAEGQSNGVSVNINGSVSGNALTLRFQSPGLVLFNGIMLGGSQEISQASDQGFGSLYDNNNNIQDDRGSDILRSLQNGGTIDNNTVNGTFVDIDGSAIGLEPSGKKLMKTS